MNKVILTGRLTAAPDLKTTNSGKSVTDFTIAVDRFVSGEKQADFIRCTAWGKQAENLCKFKKQGDKIAVDGVLRVENYTDVRGNGKFKTYVSVNEIEYLTSKPADVPDDQVVDDDDLPF